MANYHEACPCHRMDPEGVMTCAKIQIITLDACRACRIFQKAILAVVDGHFPILIPRPANDAERNAILHKIVVGPGGE